MRTALILLTILCHFILFGCTSEEPPAEQQTVEAGQPATPTEVEAQAPPTPPLREDFGGEPNISLFPRVMGDYRPGTADHSALFAWRTALDHLVSVSGPVVRPEATNRAWIFHSVNTTDSVGWFAPLAVEPGGSYQVKFSINTDLIDEATAGMTVLEFNEFLWVGEQYPEDQFKAHLVSRKEGLSLTGKQDWSEQSFDFTVSEQTQMIHLVLFRKGPHDPNPVMFDDLLVNVVNKR